jgi:hypothetical protein
MTKPNLAQEQHDLVGNFWPAWRVSADGLLYASGVLRGRMSVRRGAIAQVGPIDLMLRGFAVECLLKAIWVKKGNLLTRGGRLVPIQAGAHDLVQIAHRVGFRLTAREKDVLRRLSHFATYAGRYPVPTRAADMALTRAVGGGKAAPTTWGSTDNSIFNAVLRRLKKSLATKTAAQQ